MATLKYRQVPVNVTILNSVDQTLRQTKSVYQKVQTIPMPADFSGFGTFTALKDQLNQTCSQFSEISQWLKDSETSFKNSNEKLIDELSIIPKIEIKVRKNQVNEPSK